MEIKGRKAQGNCTRQRIYDYIVGYIIANGFPPTVREICAGVDIVSTGVVNGHLHKMHETGMIELVQYQSRCIRVPGMKFMKEEDDGKRNSGDI